MFDAQRKPIHGWAMGSSLTRIGRGWRRTFLRSGPTGFWIRLGASCGRSATVIKATKRRERPESLPAVKVSEMSDSGGCPPDPPAAGGQLRMEIIGAKHPPQEAQESLDRVRRAVPAGDAC